MTLRDMRNNLIDFQTETRFYYYDYEGNERVELTESQAFDRDIKFIYYSDGTICIEVEME